MEIVRFGFIRQNYLDISLVKYCLAMKTERIKEESTRSPGSRSHGSSLSVNTEGREVALNEGIYTSILCT